MFSEVIEIPRVVERQGQFQTSIFLGIMQLFVCNCDQVRFVLFCEQYGEQKDFCVIRGKPFQPFQCL